MKDRDGFDVVGPQLATVLSLPPHNRRERKTRGKCAAKKSTPPQEDPGDSCDCQICLSHD